MLIVLSLDAFKKKREEEGEWEGGREGRAGNEVLGHGDSCPEEMEVGGL